ncbi:MAG: efflux RND transporter permease subunit [Panacagrimonas sp.]
MTVRTNIDRFSDALSAWTRFVLRYRWVVVVFLVIVTGLAASQFGKLRTEVDLDKVLPQNDPYVATANHVRKVFGSFYSMLVGVKFQTGTICDARNLESLRKIQDAITARTTLLVGPRILSVVSPQVKDIRRAGDDVAITDLGEEMQRDVASCNQALDRAGDVKGLLFDASRTRAMFLVEYADKQGSYRDVVNAVRGALDVVSDGSFRYQLGGNVAYIAETERYADRVPLMLAGAIIVISVLLYLAFGSLQGVFIPLVTAILATLWSLGLLGYFRVAIDAFSSLTPILILVVAAGHSVQLLKRFQEEYEPQAEQGKAAVSTAVSAAVVTSLAAAGPATVAAGLAAALGFASLLSFDIRSIQIFGLFTAAGIASSVIIELTLIPVLRAALPAPMRRQRGDAWLDRLLHTVARLSGDRPKAVLCAAAILMLICGWAATTLSTDNSIKRYFSPKLAVYQDDQELNAASAGTNYLMILLQARDGHSFREPELLQALSDLDAWLLQQADVGQVYGVHRMLERMHRNWGAEKKAAEDRLPSTPEEAAQLLLLYSFSDPAGLARMVDAEYREALVMTYLRDDSTEAGRKLLAELKAWSEHRFGDQATVSFSGTVATADSLNRVMVQGKIANLVQLVLAIAVVAAVVFQSLLMALIVVAPLIVAALVNFAVIAALHFPLNVPASLSTALAVGVGADYSIYLLMRLHEELRSGKPLRSAIDATLKTAGRAIVFVSGSIATGYLMLLFSLDFYPHSLLGGLISVSMMSACLATLLLVPASIAIARGRVANTKGGSAQIRSGS